LTDPLYYIYVFKSTQKISQKTITGKFVTNENKCARDAGIYD